MKVAIDKNWPSGKTNLKRIWNRGEIMKLHQSWTEGIHWLPPTVSLAYDGADELASRTNTKSARKSNGPFKFFKLFEVCPNTVVIDEEEIPDPISTDRVDQIERKPNGKIPSSICKRQDGMLANRGGEENFGSSPLKIVNILIVAKVKNMASRKTVKEIISDNGVLKN